MTPEIKQRIDAIRRGAVPEGYKKTINGIVPAQWSFILFREILKKKLAKNVGNKIHNILTNSATEGIIRQADYFDKKITNDDNTEVYYIVEQGDFVYNPRISASAPCGPFNRYNGVEQGIMSPLYSVFSLKSEQLNSDFLKLYLRSTFWHKYMCSIANYGVRSDRMNVSNEDLLNLTLPAPVLREQQKIAEILTTQDNVIDLKEKRIAQKQRQKKYLMQQLLTGKKRLKGFSGEWITQELSAMFSERIEKNCRDLQLLAITGTKGVVPRTELDLKDNSSEDKSKYLRICAGDIGYNTMRMWQGVSAYSNYEGIVSPAYTILKPKNSVDAKYFAYLFKLPEIVFFFYRFSQGLVDDTRNLKYSNFKKIRVDFPRDVNEQSAIAKVLSTADNEIALLQKDLEQEKLKKKALMQLLLTGIVRVSA